MNKTFEIFYDKDYYYVDVDVTFFPDVKGIGHLDSNGGHTIDEPFTNFEINEVISVTDVDSNPIKDEKLMKILIKEVYNKL